MMKKGAAFWFEETAPNYAEWLCAGCCDFDPKDPNVKSDKEGYTQWMCNERGKPSKEPQSHMQTWPEFCEWGIVVESKNRDESSMPRRVMDRMERKNRETHVPGDPPASTA